MLKEHAVTVASRDTKQVVAEVVLDRLSRPQGKGKTRLAKTGNGKAKASKLDALTTVHNVNQTQKLDHSSWVHLSLEFKETELFVSMKRWNVRVREEILHVRFNFATRADGIPLGSVK